MFAIPVVVGHFLKTLQVTYAVSFWGFPFLSLSLSRWLVATVNVPTKQSPSLWLRTGTRVRRPIRPIRIY